jgi:RecA/RadA recombinase
MAAKQKKDFSLDDIKKKHSSSTKFKPKNYYYLGSAMAEIGIQGLPMCGINVLTGHSDTGKTTAMILAAIDAQKKGDLPVFLITENKWDFNRAKDMGLDIEQVDGEWVGDFIYRDDFKYIEELTDYINELLDLQEAGKLPYNLCFCWDSVGTIPCKMTYDGKGGKMQNAGVLADKIGLGLYHRINSSRKESYPYSNTLIIVNQGWVSPPDNPFGQPKWNLKGGTAIYIAATFIIRFGNITSASKQKLEAVKDGRKVLFGNKTKVSIEKNHDSGLSFSDVRIISVPHGYIADTKESIDKYKKENSEYWVKQIGSSDFSVTELDEVIDGYSEED